MVAVVILQGHAASCDTGYKMAAGAHLGNTSQKEYKYVGYIITETNRYQNCKTSF